ncbi:MAG: helix-turn-helix domain-containing protein, partial [Acetobacteraceae bacterium]
CAPPHRTEFRSPAEPRRTRRRCPHERLSFPPYLPPRARHHAVSAGAGHAHAPRRTPAVSTAEPVASIAFASGFGDLSTFNARFRTLFASSPSAFRAQSPRRSSVRVSTAASS